MEVKNIVENLIKDIQDIEKNVNTFKNSSPIPRIEIDLVLSKLRHIYDAVLQLKEIPVSGDENLNIDVAPEDLTEEVPKKKEPVDYEKMEQKEEVIKEGVMADEEVSKDFELEAESKAEPEVIEEPVPQEVQKKEKDSMEKKSAGIIADRLAAPKQFRNETLGRTFQAPDLSSKLQSQPLKDIASAIGINDRFHYIKELFDGNSKKFDDTINALNNSPNFNEAFNYLNENFNWNMDGPAVQKLLELTRRKHIINTDE